jgi:wyosine [tRNA(Phe)-imidazoG37] synthetase (radical SAM superfamily)
MSSIKILNVENHNRDIFDVHYVYPVVSRRAQGVSIGINLNVNNACNWRCIYCEIPNLSRGNPPPINLELLAQELDTMLHNVLHGDFMRQHVQEEHRVLQDIAFSGNGEPTSAKEFGAVLDIVEAALIKFDLLGKIKIRLITNGSLLDKAYVQQALRHLSRMHGEVWFKFDAATKESIARINDVTLNPLSHLQRLLNCAELCPTYVQTCVFALDGKAPSEEEKAAYVALIAEARSVIQGVHLYGIARPSMQAEANRLQRLPEAWLTQFAAQIEALGIHVKVSA